MADERDRLEKIEIAVARIESACTGFNGGGFVGEMNRLCETIDKLDDKITTVDKKANKNSIAVASLTGARGIGRDILKIAISVAAILVTLWAAGAFAGDDPVGDTLERPSWEDVRLAKADPNLLPPDYYDPMMRADINADGHVSVLDLQWMVQIVLYSRMPQ